MVFAPSLLFASEDANLTLLLFLVFAAAKVAAEVCERIGLQGSVGEIFAGMLIGPSVLGLVHPNDLLTSLSNIGVIFLLFRVGLDVRASEMLRVGAVSALVAVCGVIVPFALGWAIMAAWGYPRIENIFVGASMVATSVGITAQVLSARGVLNNRASQIIIAAAVIDDVLGLLVLAFVSSLAKGAVNYRDVAITTLLAVGFVVFVSFYGTKVMSRVVPRIQQTMRVQESEFSLCMVFLFLMALLSSYSGVAAIVGAFLAGMALSETVGQRVKDLTHGATELLLPFFLVGIGLKVDLTAFQNPATATLAAVILVAAIFSKLVGCGLGALSLGPLGALRVGVGMIPRGEVGMVVAQLGLSLGVISQSVYGIVVAMAVLTTLAAPALLGLVFRNAPKTDAVTPIPMLH